MNFFAFLDRAHKNDFWFQYRLLLFQGQHFPLLFFALFWKQIKKTVDNIQLLNCDNITYDQLLSQLATSFLGQTSLYWLGNSAHYDEKIKKKLFPFLSVYRGPHTVAFFIDEQTKIADKSACLIHIPTELDKKQYQELANFFSDQLGGHSEEFTKKIFDHNRLLSLERACLLMQYHAVVGRQVGAFVDFWLDVLVAPEKSLFILSQYFFAKDAQSFFRHWSMIKSTYPDIFWVSYWSEQLWRAACFVKLVRSKNNIEAKRISYRLPFSFMQRQWRQYYFNELTQAHQFIYSIDFKLKNGSSAASLDLFYTKFISGAFQ